MIADHAVMFENLDDHEKKMLGKWYLIPNFGKYMLYIIMVFSFYTLYRQFKESK